MILRATHLTAAFVILTSARLAVAFPTGAQFDADALVDDGGGGHAFSGSPLDTGHGCDVCHTGAPRRLRLELEAEPFELFTDGYVPGTTYRLRVVLHDDWAARAENALGDACGAGTSPYRRCDENGFALAMVSSAGLPAGALGVTAGVACATTVPATAEVRRLDDGTAITHSGLHAGRTSWDLCWIAPLAGTGTVTAHVAAVDGGGGDGTPANPEDAGGDDVAIGAVAFAERGHGPRVQGGGCSASRGTGTAAAVVVVVLASLVARLARRRRRRSAALVGVVTASTLAAGCVHVKPHEKQDLAQRKMVFAPDATEDELDLHMQEAREGSSGGYGSAGGGCGCN